MKRRDERRRRRLATKRKVRKVKKINFEKNESNFWTRIIISFVLNKNGSAGEWWRCVIRETIFDKPKVRPSTWKHDRVQHTNCNKIMQKWLRLNLATKHVVGWFAASEWSAKCEQQQSPATTCDEETKRRHSTHSQSTKRVWKQAMATTNRPLQHNHKNVNDEYGCLVLHRSLFINEDKPRRSETHTQNVKMRRN